MAQVIDAISIAWDLVKKIESGEATEDEVENAIILSDYIESTIQRKGYDDCLPEMTKFLGHEAVSALRSFDLEEEAG